MIELAKITFRGSWMVTEVSDFEREVLEASHEAPVLVDFWAPWCGPCRQLGPVLEKLAGENEGVWTLAKLNTDENPEVSQRYRVSSIPAVKLFVDGEVVDEFLGALPETSVRRWLENAVPNETKRRMDSARALLAEGDAAGAEVALRELLAEDESNPAVRVLLAQTVAFRDLSEAAGLVEDARALDADLIRVRDAVLLLNRLVTIDTGTLPEAPAREPYARAIDALKMSDLDTALESLIEVVRRDRKYDDDGARRAVLAVFALLGEKHATTRKHRRSFDMAVF
jgi:putative thioredoxin